MTEKDDGRIWIKTGGDELTELGRLEYPEGQKPPLQERIAEAFTPSFWKDVEKLEKECRDNLISSGYPKPEKSVWHDKDKQWRYFEDEETPEYPKEMLDLGYGLARGFKFAEEVAKPFSKEWYSANIWDLIWTIKRIPGTTDELLAQRLFNLGALVTDADWRSTYKPSILTGMKQRGVLDEHRDQANQKKIVKMGRRRSLILNMLEETHLTGGALEQHLLRRLKTEYKISASTRTIRRDLHDIRGRL